LLNDELGILTYQRLELLVVSCVLSDQLGLVCRNIAGEGFATFPTLEVVVRTIGSVAKDAEFTRFHALDLGDLLEQLSKSSLIHSWNIYMNIYINTKYEPSGSFARITSYARSACAFAPAQL
jgi:hypothetical protein